jgi:anti-sigma28 factor (negative regulator of flagellin synthesis)
MELERLLELVRLAPDVRQGRVDSLQLLIESGRYRIDLDRLVDCLLAVLR